ncbi:MAG: alcohol dehydrogenase catalytic domain-containing protein [Alphaproteobacteria bacterium]|jgi:propanol-preferring alcohol dehydrogenase
MRAMVVREWGQPFTLEERPDPEPGPGEAMMKVRAAGVGLTLVTMRTGVFGGEAPRVMGHELGGDIVAVGDGVTNVKPGDRCAVYFYLNCGYCRWCHGGRETLCENHGGYVGVHVDGGYADYVVLPAGNFLPIPEGLGYEDAAIAADAVNTNWHCMRERAKIAPHDDVLLIGAGGGVGVHGIQVAKAFGARVIAADISDEKLEFAKKWGADEVINVREVNDIAEAAKKLTDGRGVDAAVDYVGASETFTAAIEALATAGRAVLIGAKPSSVRIDPLDLLINEKTITGSRHSTRTELMETMDVMAKGTIKSAIGKRVHFTEVESLFEDLQAETLLGRGALTYDD